MVVAFGSIRGSHGVDRLQVLPGTRGQGVSSIAGNSASGTIALVTNSMYRGGAATRTLWLYRHRVFSRALTVRPGANTPDTAVAVGQTADVLFVWQTRRSIYARHVSPSGHAGRTHRLGAGRQSALQARVDDDGRLEVAWESQRVSEGFAETPATVSYASAPHDGRFTAAHPVGGFALTGIGRYIMRPGVRLVATGPNTSALAWSGDDGTHLRLFVADVTAGRVAVPQTVSPPDDDAVLGDLASAPAGGQLVLWLTGTRGASPTGPQRVAAAVRPPGATSFGRPELVSDPVGAPGTPDAATSVAYAPRAAIDARTGHGLAAWTTLDQHPEIALR